MLTAAATAPAVASRSKAGPIPVRAAATPPAAASRVRAAEPRATPALVAAPGVGVSAACIECGETECAGELAACLEDAVCTSCLEDDYGGPDCMEGGNPTWFAMGECVCQHYRLR